MSRRPPLRHALLATLLLATLALAGCGGSSTSSSSGGAGSASSAAATAHFTFVEYTLSVDHADLKAGPQTFTATNEGQKHHELLILTGTDLSNLPATSDGSIDVAALGSRVVGHIGDLAPGASGADRLTLQTGTYSAVCNMPGMAAQAAQPNDMHLQLHVSA